jgi:DNA-binding transcriptional MerR regulator
MMIANSRITKYSSGEALAMLADMGYITTPRVIRNIEQELELPISRDATHQRIYTPEDVAQLAAILALQEAGLRLATIQRILIERDVDAISFHRERLRHALGILEELS